MDLTTLDAELAVASFVETLRTRLPDDRDRRGKLHSLEFTVTAVVLAMLCSCQSVSSIHRFIEYKLTWLRHVTGMRTACALSRAHLPRLLNRIDWTGLNLLITECFGATVSTGDWVAVDGKVLRGSSRDGERQALVIAVAHATGHEVARLLQAGPKTSEIPVVRQLLKDTGLERQKVTMDAGHCNPTTLAQIAQAGGTALVQVKENQSELLYVCTSRSVHEPALARLCEMEKSHGRVTTRTTELFALRPGALDARWDASQLRYLVTVLRETYSPRDKQTTRETSYYVTNAATTLSSAGQLRELTSAIRGHWCVEANNWVRDVTFGEDLVRCRAPNQAQVLALFRSLALAVARKAKGTNLREVIDQFCMVPRKLVQLLNRIKFL